jgi:hypothetical protein
VTPEELLGAAADANAIHDVGRIERLLREAAAEARSISYAEILNALDLRFTRPKMRALCRTLDEVDARARSAGEPELAVLVVRESDGLPGQGWWTGRTNYEGDWTGAQARAYVNRVQSAAFRHWKRRLRS